MFCLETLELINTKAKQLADLGLKEADALQYITDSRQQETIATAMVQKMPPIDVKAFKNKVYTPSATRP